MTSGPVVVGILSGPKVIETWRTMMGATRPEEALPGTIRGDFAKAAGDNQAIQNVVHGSDSEASAKREIALSGLRIRLVKRTVLFTTELFFGQLSTKKGHLRRKLSFQTPHKV